MDPTTMIILTGISTAFTALSFISQGAQAKSMASFNAAMQEREAKRVKDVAAVEEAEARRRTKRLISSQIAATGASGTTMEGAPILLNAEAAEDGELDALGIRYAGDVESINRIAEASRQRFEGDVRRTTSFLKAGSALLSGAAQIGGIQNSIPPPAAKPKPASVT